MVELDPESRKCTTMALDIGRFQWMRLPMCSCTILLSFVGNLPSYQMKSERHHNIFVRDTVLLGSAACI